MFVGYRYGHFTKIITFFFHSRKNKTENFYFLLLLFLVLLHAWHLSSVNFFVSKDITNVVLNTHDEISVVTTITHLRSYRSYNLLLFGITLLRKKKENWNFNISFLVIAMDFAILNDISLTKLQLFLIWCECGKNSEMVVDIS